MGLAAIAFGDQDGFEQCYREFAPDSAVEFQGEREKAPGLELVERFKWGWREQGHDAFYNVVAQWAKMSAVGLEEFPGML